ncbi:MAG: hypothetical protein ACLT3Y_02290 [Ruminococcus callidus]
MQQRTKKKASAEGIRDYLKKLDEFDLNEYMTLIRFDQLKVPTVPFHLPSSRNYYGIEQMKQGELDFFRATALSRSKEPIFITAICPWQIWHRIWNSTKSGCLALPPV